MTEALETAPEPARRPNDRPTSPPEAPGASDVECVERLGRAYTQLTGEIEKVIVGQRAVVDQLLIALFAGGHCILTGVPGLAKTLLVSTLARALSLSFRRVQFTPDLMPSDITGTEVLQRDPATDERTFRFIRGPVFTHILLADEINRTPPKTQSALLEAMEEHRVTVGERTLDLPSPFFVIATQNPIEQEGTYNLPEAQLDRFLFGLRVEYPSSEDELDIMQQTMRPEEVAIDEVLDAKTIQEIQAVVPRVPIAESVCRTALELVRATRPDHDEAPDYVRTNVSWGAGPRAAKNLVQAAKARALVRGRFHVTADDIRAIADPVLAHRIVTNFHAAVDGLSGAGIVARLLDDRNVGART